MAQGDPYILDFGAHVNIDPPGPSVMFDLIEEQAGAPIHRDPAAARRLYDEAGIDGAVLSQSNYIGYDDAEAARDANDKLLDGIEGYDDFYALAALPSAAGGEAAASEFERCLENGYNGGAVENRNDGAELIDEELAPVLEVADQTGAPLLVHPVINDSLHPGALDDTWQLNAIFGREIAMCESICKVIHEGVLDRYPDLNLVYHHTAGNIAGFLGRIELQLEKDRWPGLDGLKDYAEFKAKLDERIYIDSSGHYGDRGVFAGTLDRIPASQFMYGTDFPYETRTPAIFRKLVDSIQAVASDGDARRILGGNALDLLVNVD